MTDSSRSRARARRRTSLPALCLCAALLPATSACDSERSGTTPAASAPATSTTAASSSGASAKSPASAAASSKPLKNANPKAYKHTEEQALGTLPEGVGIAVGQKAPDFELPDGKDGKLSLKSLLAKSEVLLVFYRGGW